jgi:hypothetical protein
MNESDEIPQAIEIMRGVIAAFEFKALAGSDPPETVINTIKEIIFVAMSHGKAPPRRGAPCRGVGYDFDDAQIVASLPDHDDSLERAVRAHWQRDDDEWLDEGQIETIIKRIRKHKKQVEEIGMPDYIGAPPLRGGN